ncbi:MAG: hypothetical protein ACPGUU_06205 [Flavobacteriaceae bacterium]
MEKSYSNNSKFFIGLVAGIVMGFICSQIFPISNSETQSFLNTNSLTTKNQNTMAKSKHYISVEKSLELSENFKKRFTDSIRKIQLNSGVDRKEYDPTEYLHIGLQELKEYITLLEHVQKENPDNPDISGVSINLSAYNLDKKSNLGDYRGRINVFLAPTIKRDDIETPFYIKYKDEENTYKGEYKDLFDNENLKDGSGKQSLSLNELGAIPPKP